MGEVLGLTRDDLIADNLGKRCIVLSHQNNFLFQGEMTGFDSDEQQIEVTWNQLSPPPWGAIVPDRKLKLTLKDSGSSGALIVVEGCVARVMKDNLILDLESVFSKKEDRSCFRQLVMKSGAISLPEEDGPGHPCTIVDISAGGVGLTTQGQYDIGQLLLVKNLRLRDGGHIHSVTCAVRRKREEPGKGFFYGCAFSGLTMDQEDALYADLFAMQASDLRRKRDQ